MPRQKDLKRVVRTRMSKTGESYTAARAQVLRRKLTVVPPLPEPDYLKLTGYRDETVLEKTGRTWKDWVDYLDAAGAKDQPHGEIARLVYARGGISGWWSQMVSVGYERIRGLRAIGQRRSGSWEAKKSKTFPVPVAVLFDAFAKPRVRAKWLTGAKYTVRKASAPKSMRITWEDGSSVELWFMAKGEAKSSVAVQHVKLPSKEEADRLRSYWSDRFDALAEMLR